MKTKKNLHVHYDEEGDLLEIRMGDPTKGYMKSIGNDLFERIDEETGEIRGYTILNFKKRAEKTKSFDVLLPFKLDINA